MMQRLSNGRLSKRAGDAERGIHCSYNSLLKRAFDVTVSATLITFLAPAMAVIALAIFVQDGRSIFYGHRRVGRGGASFRCWKFRTMVTDADERLEELLRDDAASRQEWQATQKLKNDPRIIPGVGKFLRQSSLDELPQLFNVLSGEMSLVGPRPVVADELEKYGAARAHYTSVRPGLTGPWQIGERSDGDYHNRVSKDVDYVENWSFKTDVVIVLQTATVPFRQSGAY